MIEDKENLWAKLFQRERPSIDVDFPVNDGEETLKMKVIELTAEEATVCEMDAEKKVKELFKGNLPQKGEQSNSYDSMYNKYNSANMLYRACRNVNDSKIKIFPTPDAVLKYCSVDQMGVLMNNYYDLMATKGCIKAISDPEELEITMQRLIEDGTNARFLLLSCSLEFLKDLIMHLVSQLSNQPTDNSSVILPQNDMQEMTESK